MAESSSPPRGFELIHDPRSNKSTAFDADERERLGLTGLLPGRVFTQDVQARRILEILRRRSSDIDRYVALMALQGRNERLFYRILIDHLPEIMPLVYTPTVGEACRDFAHVFRQPRGFHVTPDQRGRIAETLRNWPQRDVKVIVVTDGERILGLGDLGANGMGICIGKLALYCACAGIRPEQCLPIHIDVGTDNRALLDDPLYLGLVQPRLRDAAYLELVDEFVDAVGEVFPGALIQFEDFLTPNAFALLERYRERALCFNDDIQGTAAVALAGIYAAARKTGREFGDMRIMFLGAGSAATGIGNLLVSAFMDCGLDEASARERLWFVDIHGLVHRGRDHVAEHNLPFAHDHPPTDLLGALASIRPHALIGATGCPGTFSRSVIESMSQLNEQPIVFALSNPTSRAECTAEQAYRWSAGKVVFASGSPFPAMSLAGGRRWRPGQGNNVYAFPGIGMGVLAAGAQRVSDPMFLAAAKAIANRVSEEDLAEGAVYPPLERIRDVSLDIAVAVVAQAEREGHASRTAGPGLREEIAATMYDPSY